MLCNMISYLLYWTIISLAISRIKSTFFLFCKFKWYFCSLTLPGWISTHNTVVGFKTYTVAEQHWVTTPPHQFSFTFKDVVHKGENVLSFCTILKSVFKLWQNSLQQKVLNILWETLSLRDFREKTLKRICPFEM